MLLEGKDHILRDPSTGSAEEQGLGWTAHHRLSRKRCLGVTKWRWELWADTLKGEYSVPGPAPSSRTKWEHPKAPDPWEEPALASPVSTATASLRDKKGCEEASPDEKQIWNKRTGAWFLDGKLNNIFTTKFSPPPPPPAIHYDREKCHIWRKKPPLSIFFTLFYFVLSA